MKDFSSNVKARSDKNNPRRNYYRGNIAINYEKERESETKWKLEQVVIEKIIAGIEAETSILDVPFGTGRFLKIYEQNTVRNVIGLDISKDMLSQARQKISEHSIRNRIWMTVGDAEHLPIKDDSVDYVVCIRFLNWLSGAAFDNVLTEYQRVARHGIIVGVRTCCRLRFSHLIRLRSPYIKPALEHIISSVKPAIMTPMKRIGLIESSFLPISSKAKKSSYDNEKNEFKLHDENYVLTTFAEKRLSISRKFSFDVRWDEKTKLVLPYTIYLLKPEHHTQGR